MPEVYNLIKQLSKSSDTRNLVFLNGNGQGQTYLAWGTKQEFRAEANDDALRALENFYYDNGKPWLFGFLSYDLKNQLEHLFSENRDGINAPILYFFIPKYVFEIKEDSFEQVAGDEVNLGFSKSKSFEDEHSYFDLTPTIDYNTYKKHFDEIKRHIQRGDVYELNYCFEFQNASAKIDPWIVYKRINQRTKAPFSTYAKFNDLYVLSASPERYLKKDGQKIISQPIKGTMARGRSRKEDQELIEKLRNSPKEQSENVMITDLVRNDLSRTAVPKSVRVEQLFEIQSFQTVHQMVTTVSSELASQYNVFDVIRTTFPMGSMTGAPKVSAMKLIEQYESTRRGIYSGAIGYITPDENCDFNVVIRSLIYQKSLNYLSLMVGSAITAKSNARAEYNECLLKAKALRNMFDEVY